MTTLETSDPVTDWAEEVVEGSITSGHFGRLACQRHLNDLKAAHQRGLEWRPEAALRALKFFPAILKVTAGAKAGEPFYLPSYTTFVVGSLFGWYRKGGDRLRFRTAWVEAGKGQIKSPVAAAIGLYTLFARGIPRAECYAIAKDRNQANVLFGDAVAMALAEMPDAEFDGESLVSRGTILTRGTGDMTWMLEHPASGSKFRSLAGDEKVNGPRPSYVAADEIHEWKSDGALNTWKSAGAKMPGDFLLWMSTNTPAADQIIATEWSEMHQRILRGEAEDDAAFAFIARVDPGDKPFEDESCWPKSMPCLGITFPIENVRIEVNSARNSVGARLSTERLYFGVPVGASEYWIDLDAWDAVQGSVSLDDAENREVYLTLDLSKKNDLTALGIGFVDAKGVLNATVRYWKPAEKLKQKAQEDHAQYVEWAAAVPPLLNLVPGRSIDYEFIAVLVKQLVAKHSVSSLVVDPAYLTDFRKACDNVGLETWVWDPDEPFGSGLKIMIHGQGRMGMQSKKALWMPRSLQKFEDRILQRKILIDESPITRWCSGNAAVQPDAQNNRFFIKKHQRGRIDGMTVLAMLSGATDEVEATGRSFWDSDDNDDDADPD
ncbi:terminase large subunit [Pararhizobium sp. BT-229]|uniref:terminase large subunit n=1 Tax=Pararhizobium sp. BT-229 TaxID=2986923 RepID=UPI0021F6B700|nr:terminase TerL endonuclease subunit [Pararhizobium sp. BT-229]MCV9960743.1 terminase large subunit [Pararhizobium sp. BT-229]